MQNTVTGLHLIVLGIQADFCVCSVLWEDDGIRRE